MTTSLETDQGGPPVSVYNYSACSVHTGIRAEVVTTIDARLHESTMLAQIEQAGAKVHACQRSHLFGRFGKRWGISFSLLRWILRSARNYDIIVLHGGWSFSSVAGLVAARIVDRPCILVPHESLTHYDVNRRGSLIRILMKKLLRKAYWRYCDMLIFSSQLEARDSSIHGGKARIAVLPHPIYDDRLPNRAGYISTKTRFRRLGFLGRLHPKKNLALVISALADTNTEIALTVAGDGPEKIKETLFEVARRHGVEGRIEWIGFVEGAAKEAFFQRIDVLAMPSEYESFGLVAAEAMVRGVPVVVTSRSGIAEVIRESGGGLVCDPRQEDFSRALKQLEVDEDLVPVLSRRASDTATRQLSFTAFGTMLKEYYNEILAEHHRRLA